MKKSIKEKINKLVENCHFHVYPAFAEMRPGQVMALVSYHLLAKNGKAYPICAFAVDGNELISEQQAINRAKECLRKHIAKDLSQRTGLKYHKGYFRFVDILLMDEIQDYNPHTYEIKLK